MGYNGVTTWFSTYVSQVMGEGIGGTNTCLMVATVGAIVSYIPIGHHHNHGYDEKQGLIIHVDQPLGLFPGVEQYADAQIEHAAHRPHQVDDGVALGAQGNLAKDDGSGGEVLPGPVKRSLIFLLASIALWY